MPRRSRNGRDRCGSRGGSPEVATPVALLPGGEADPRRPVVPDIPATLATDGVMHDRVGTCDHVDASAAVATEVDGTGNPEGAEAVAPPAGRPPRITWGDDVPLVLPVRDPRAPKPGRSRGGRVAWTHVVRDVPATGTFGAPFRSGASASQVRAHVAASARDAIERDLCIDLTRERGGFLVGTVERLGDGRLVVDVRAAIPADGAEGGSSWWQLTPQAWDHASRILETRHPGLLIVGWYHSHPGIGCFFSHTDRETQRHVFPNPWNLAAVADPVAPRRWWNLRGMREAVPPGVMPFRWYLGPEAVPVAPPEAYDDAPPTPSPARRALPRPAPRWRMRGRRDR